ncbi:MULTISPECIES: phosphopantetheine-binding protein [Micromonospora]|uniref:thioesterase domain-containing protein n=1 Tax=Micromonospora TaxID=1873 RepID=UPI001AE3234E|nr:MULTISPECIES: phosphopantetheine-binding protein [unclassified Micromonospora]MBP1780668.1 thioesterase domain-containing protein/acyl carrier protein [Micromonospora sp. HB375]MDH6468892.1 thioesterase domain-containing protein/acyl carrier protein [Micromonospora sp. H404/HB375]
MMRDTIEVVVATQWSRVLGVAAAHLDEDFFDAGGDSLLAARLAVALRKATGLPVDLGTVFEARTLRGISQALRTENESWGRLLTLAPDGARAPLMLLPSGGGGVIGLNSLASYPLDRPVYAATAKGLRPEEGEPFASLAELVADFAALMTAAGLPRRLHLGGFCLGGNLAVELARRLLVEGWEVLSVNLFNTSLYAPPIDPEELIRARLAGLVHSAGLTTDPEELRPEAVFELLSAHSPNGLVETDHAAFLARLRVAAMLRHSISGHLPEPVAAPVRLFSAPDRDDPEEVAAVGCRLPDWSELEFPDFAQVDVSVGHHQMLHDEQVLKVIAASLVDCEEQGS